MRVFGKKLLGSDAFLSELKTYVERAKSLYPDVSNQMSELNALIASPNDKIKSEIEKDTGMSLDDVKFVMECQQFHLRYFAPLQAALVFIMVTDIPKLGSDEELLKDITKPILEQPDWDDVFETLAKLPLSVTEFYIVQIECSNDKKNSILEAIRNSDPARFKEIITKMGRESYVLKNVADLYKMALIGYFSTDSILRGGDNLGQSYYLEKGFDELNKEDPDSVKYIEKVMDAASMGNELIESDTFPMSPTELTDVYSHIMRQYIEYRKNYLVKRQELSVNVQEYIDEFVEEPEEIDLYNELERRGCTFDAPNMAEIVNTSEGLSDSSADIFLPKSFFNIQNRNAERSIGLIGINYIECNDAISKFCSVINYLSKHGYIKNDKDVKRTLAYKLSGYSINFDKEKIEWFGDTNILSVLISKMVEGSEKWQKAKKVFVFENGKQLFNSSTLRKNATYDAAFAKLFKELYAIDLYK